jgi:D-alanyl-lipoteichoic acid acyltransferase DltB (MBOAT superfamily)
LPYSYLFLLGLIPALVSSALVAVFPILRKPLPALTLGLISSLAFFRKEFPAALLLTLVIWVAIQLIGRIPGKAPRARALRWKYSSALLITISAWFLLMDLFFPSRLVWRVFGVTWIIYGHQMILFLRLTSLLWELGIGRVSCVPALAYFQWVFFPCTLESLVWRFSDFQKQHPVMSSAERPKLSTSWRSLGLLACFQISGALLLQNTTDFFVPKPNMSLAESLYKAFLVGPWLFYGLNAGAANLLRTTGRLWQVELPEGYNKAYGRVNISDFWAHFNMTVTALVRDMVFYNRWGMKKMNPYFNVVVVFVLIGLWHKSDLHYLSWGLINGLGFAMYLWWRSNSHLTGVSERLGIPQRVSRIALAALTYVFVCSTDFMASKLALLAQS